VSAATRVCRSCTIRREKAAAGLVGVTKGPDLWRKGTRRSWGGGNRRRSVEVACGGRKRMRIQGWLEVRT
jgi:hypothetical protein